MLEHSGRALVIDPYLSRFGPRDLLLSSLTPNAAAIRAQLPSRAEAVVCGHSHFDHLLDAPLFAQLSNAKLVGSGTTVAIGRAHGLPREQLVAIPPTGGEVALPSFSVTFVPSLHAQLLFGRVPFPGEVSEPRLPLRPWQYRMGGAFGVLVRAAGVSVYHNGSADLVDAELQGHHADVLLVGLAGRRHTPDYLKRLLRLLRPRLVIPAHHDAFFSPLSAGVRLLPGIDFRGFVDEVRLYSPQAQVIAPLYNETLCIAAGASDAGLSDV